jgi:hypothetical protein
VKRQFISSRGRRAVSGRKSQKKDRICEKTDAEDVVEFVADVGHCDGCDLLGPRNEKDFGLSPLSMFLQSLVHGGKLVSAIAALNFNRTMFDDHFPCFLLKI